MPGMRQSQAGTTPQLGGGAHRVGLESAAGLRNAMHVGLRAVGVRRGPWCFRLIGTRGVCSLWRKDRHLAVAVLAWGSPATLGGRFLFPQAVSAGHCSEVGAGLAFAGSSRTSNGGAPSDDAPPFAFPIAPKLEDVLKV